MTKNQLEESQIVLVTVDKIIGTTVFVKLDDYNLEGTISFPEIAPGRIRNIRDYAFPGKKIVCKVLQIHSNSIELSLRRVKVNERNDFNDRYRKERNYLALFRTVLQEKSDEKIEEIKEKESSFYDLIENSKENPKLLEKYISKEQSDKILKILSEKKNKETSVSKKFELSSKAPNGIIKIKEILSSSIKGCVNCEVSYLAAGKYLVKLKAQDAKQADQKLRAILENIESQAKKQNCVFNQEKD
jgi:translation initiation factor 2 subunit 1